MDQTSKSPSWLYYWLPPLILSLITGLVYYPSLHYEFQFDDVANISKYFGIRHATLSDLFFSGTRWISSWLNTIYYGIGRFDPFSYRVGNLIIHTTNGILIFFLLFVALSGLRKESFFKNNSFFLACLTSLLFLLHPVQTQTVSYVIQGELEGLAALFILSMSLTLIFFSRAQSLASKGFLLILLYCLAALSCGTKEIAIISPALLILIDWFFIAQGEWDSLKKRLWIHASVATIIVGIYLHLLKPQFFTNIIGLKKVAKNNIGNVITHIPDQAITPWMFFISQFKVILHYLWIFIWPFGISVEYDWMLAKGLLAPDSFLALLALIGLGYIVYRLLRASPEHLLGFAALWFFICIAPRSSIVPSPELLVDYKTYSASFGWLFILACGLIKLFNVLATKYRQLPLMKHHAYANLAFTFLLAIPLGIGTMQRNTVWRSGLEFWANILKNAPGKARAYNNYGVELSQQLKKYQESIPYFKKAIAMDSKYPDPCNNLAVAYSHLGQTDNAIDALKQGLKINPYYPEGYNNLASFFLQKKRYDEAEKILRTALKLRPYYGKAFFNLGRTYLEKGDNEKAWQCFKDACYNGDLDTDMGFATYAKVSSNLKKYDDAIAGYSKVLELNPAYPEAAFNLANAYFMAEKYEKAVQLYEQLAQKSQDYKVLYNLGESYLKLNKPEQALSCFNKIHNRKAEMPHMHIRMAACYEKMGQREQAKKELSTLINTEKAPQELKQIAQGLLAQLSLQGKQKAVVHG